MSSFSDQSCGFSLFGGQGQGDLYVVGLGSFFKCLRGSCRRVRHGVVFLLAYEVPGLSFAARVGAGSTRSVNIR